MQQPVCGSPVVADLIGRLPAERPERHRDGSPIELLPLGVSQVFFAGQMFAAHVAPYETAAKRAGDPLQTPHFLAPVTSSSSIRNQRCGRR
jgi:hypothetical protein